MPAPRRPRVLVAMSGGVDSTVAAALLLEQGYDVTGVTMRVAPAAGGALECVHDARRAARRLGIAHRVWDGADVFEREVITDFVNEYLAGRTPNPCVRCNPRIKFGALRDAAAEVGADYFATGHYVQLEQRGPRRALRRALHRDKDQSYVLAGLAQEQLRGCLFPLGVLTKDQTRRRALSLGLPNADRPESQEICFVPDDDYAAFLEKRLGAPKPGPILSTRGEVLGQHRGLIRYTVGQRRGLGIAAPRPLYVVGLDPERNAVIVGHEQETYCKGLRIEPVNWGAVPAQRAPFECLAQIRYLHRPVPATATPAHDAVEVRFHEPERAVTPGQWAALYDADDYVLAAGTIEAAR